MCCSHVLQTTVFFPPRTTDLFCTVIFLEQKNKKKLKSLRRVDGDADGRCSARERSAANADVIHLALPRRPVGRRAKPTTLPLKEHQARLPRHFSPASILLQPIPAQQRGSRQRAPSARPRDAIKRATNRLRERSEGERLKEDAKEHQPLCVLLQKPARGLRPRGAAGGLDTLDSFVLFMWSITANKVGQIKTPHMIQ